MRRILGRSQPKKGPKCRAINVTGLVDDVIVVAVEGVGVVPVRTTPNHGRRPFTLRTQNRLLGKLIPQLSVLRTLSPRDLGQPYMVIVDTDTGVKRLFRQDDDLLPMLRG